MLRHPLDKYLDYDLAFVDFSWAGDNGTEGFKFCKQIQQSATSKRPRPRLILYSGQKPDSVSRKIFDEFREEISNYCDRVFYKSYLESDVYDDIVLETFRQWRRDQLTALARVTPTLWGKLEDVMTGSRRSRKQLGATAIGGRRRLADYYPEFNHLRSNALNQFLEQEWERINQDRMAGANESPSGVIASFLRYHHVYGFTHEPEVEQAFPPEEWSSGRIAEHPREVFRRWTEVRPQISGFFGERSDEVKHFECFMTYLRKDVRSFATTNLQQEGDKYDSRRGQSLQGCTPIQA